MSEMAYHTATFYESLAHLFYAMAAVDNRVRTAEKRSIKKLVEKDWSVVTNTLNSQEVIFSMLKKLFEEKYNKEAAFLNFRDFYLQHREDFPEELKKKIMHGVNKIANAFAGRNKSESVLVSRLYFLMWK